MNEWVSECVSREVDCIFMECLMFKKKEGKKAYFPFVPHCSLLSYTVQHCVTAICRLAQCSLMPSVFQHHFSVSSTTSESIVYWTQAYVFCHSKGRNPKLWPTQKHTVKDVGRLGSALVCSSPFELTHPGPFSNTTQKMLPKRIVTKDESTSMSEKVLQKFKVTMSVRIILYALVWC